MNASGVSPQLISFPNGGFSSPGPHRPLKPQASADGYFPGPTAREQLRAADLRRVTQDPAQGAASLPGGKPTTIPAWQTPMAVERAIAKPPADSLPNFGILMAANGITKMKEGNIVDGLADTVAGGLSTVGTAAWALGSSVAGPLGVAATIIDAGHDVVNGIATDNSQKTTVGGIKLLAAAAMGGATVATGTVIGAPLGALLAATAMALLGGTSIFEHRQAIGDWLNSNLAQTPGYG